MNRILLIATLLVSSLGAALPADGSRPEHVVVISIDGLMPDSYVHPAKHGLKIPNLRALVEKGCASPGVLGVYPTVTYPSHTSLMTGRNPADHGIVDNTPLDPFNLTNGGWYYYAAEIKVPTLWQVAKAAGKKTASVFWPVTVGADIDYNVPEGRFIRTEHDLALQRALSTPGLMKEIETRFGAWDPEHVDDRARAQAAAHILAKYKPNLLLLHLFDLDHDQHYSGIDSPTAVQTLEKTDALLGLIQKEAEAAGMADRIAWVIVSDHGFRSVKREFHPRAVLRSLGYMTYDDRDRLKSWRVYARLSGGSFALVAKDPQDKQAIDHATAFFRKLAADGSYGISKVFSPAELKEMGARPDAFLAIDAAPDFTIGYAGAGAWVTESNLKGTHGYDPRDPELFSSMLFSGKGVAKCQSLADAKMLDVAPTAAALLGIKMPSARGKILEQAVAK